MVQLKLLSSEQAIQLSAWRSYRQLISTEMEIKKTLVHLLSLLMAGVSYFPAAIYAYFYVEFFTKYRTTYQQIGHRNKDSQVKNVLDIGTATGGPLLTIVDCFKQARVLGIDYNSHYIPACKKLFRDHTNVDIKQMNFYDLELEEPETLFDVIIFGSSFMILPDQTKALEIATRRLAKGGKIYILLTLYQERTLINRVLQVVKPLLKYLCTVDFGQVTYMKDFEAFLQGHELLIKFSERCTGNFFLSLAKFYIYEIEKNS